MVAVPCFADHLYNRSHNRHSATRPASFCRQDVLVRLEHPACTWLLQLGACGILPGIVESNRGIFRDMDPSSCGHGVCSREVCRIRQRLCGSREVPWQHGHWHFVHERSHVACRNRSSRVLPRCCRLACWLSLLPSQPRLCAVVL